MSNKTEFAKAYIKASEALMEAIANPNRNTFDLASQWATRAQSWATHEEPQDGTERDLAGRLYEAVVMASKHHYCSLIY